MTGFDGRGRDQVREQERLRRQARYRAGLWSEVAAEALLRLKGYRILGRRFRTPVGEIDLVGRRGNRLAFVEVKSRPTFEEALQSVTEEVQRRVMRAAEWWMARDPRLARLEPAFDVVLVAAGRLPRHLTDAFDPMRGHGQAVYASRKGLR